MVAKVSVKGRIVIPDVIRKQAHIGAGDEMDIGYSNGLIVMRKRKPLTPAQIRSLLLSENDLPALSPESEASVTSVVERVRKR